MIEKQERKENRSEAKLGKHKNKISCYTQVRDVLEKDKVTGQMVKKRYLHYEC